jgi:hypothetical protein
METTLTLTKIRQDRVRTEGSSIDDTLTPSDHDANAETIDDTIDYLASQIADILGKPNWWDTPDTNLATIGSEIKPSIRATLSFDTSSPITIGDVLTNGRPYKVIINVTTAFDGASESTLSIGDAVDIDRLVTTEDVDLHTIGTYDITTYYNYGSLTSIIGTYVQDSATVGAATIEVLYTLP